MQAPQPPTGPTARPRLRIRCCSGHSVFPRQHWLAGSTAQRSWRTDRTPPWRKSKGRCGSMIQTQAKAHAVCTMMAHHRHEPLPSQPCLRARSARAAATAIAPQHEVHTEHASRTHYCLSPSIDGRAKTVYCLNADSVEASHEYTRCSCAQTFNEFVSCCRTQNMCCSRADGRDQRQVRGGARRDRLRQ